MMLKHRLYKILRMFHLISKKKYKKLVASYLAVRTPDYLIIAKSRLFDKRWYLAHNPDIKTSGIDPVWHYLNYGWKENRDCTPYFDGKKYLEKYPDVAAGNINPLLHWEKYGKTEGRDAGISTKIEKIVIRKRNKHALNKGVIYTCITGNYDNLIQHTCYNQNWDYVCFTDNEKLLKADKVGMWTIRKLQFNKLDNIRNARWHKTHPHVLFPDYEYSIWVDGNINVVGKQLVKSTCQMVRKGIVLAAPIHPSRTCIYEEAEAIIRMHKDNKSTVRAYLEILYEKKYPYNFGLNETGILFRLHNDKLCKKLMNEWFDEIRKYSYRDQLSFNYVLWKNDYKQINLFGLQTLENNKNFEFSFNNDHKTTKSSEKLLVHLHLYYKEQLDYFLYKLENITLDYDLIVTTDEITNDIKSKILAFKKNARIIKVENVGYDIYPFWCALQKVDLDNYAFLLKVHTKNYRTSKYINKNKVFTKNEWRDCLVDALLYTKKQFERNIDILKRHDKCGVVAAASLIRNIKKDGDSNFEKKLYPLLKETLKITLPMESFVCGTMFLGKACLFEIFKKLPLAADDFCFSSKTSETYSFAHALERYLGLIVYQQHKIILGIDDLLKADNIIGAYDFDTLNFKTYTDLSFDIKSNLDKFKDIDLIVGVPRSGMIPAYILGQNLNCMVCSVDEFVHGIYQCMSCRKLKNIEIKNVLVLDDSINKGVALSIVREKLAKLSIDYNIRYGAVYATQESKKNIDVYCSILEQPRMFEWNYLNHSFVQHSCFDMDGVLCKDPEDSENDDGEKYLEFIKNAEPLLIPRYKIKAIVTSRLEKYRRETETWLKNHGVLYEKLYMLDLPNKEVRQKLNAHVTFKSKMFEKLKDTCIFYESDRQQAVQIAESTHKPVFCVSTVELFK